MAFVNLLPATGITGQTLIQTTDGVRELQTFFGKRAGTPDFMASPELSPNTGRTLTEGDRISLPIGATVSEISRLMYTGLDLTYKVTTISGKIIHGSPSLPVLVMCFGKKHNIMQFVPMSDVSTKHFIIGAISNSTLFNAYLRSDDIAYIRSIQKGVTYEKFIILNLREQILTIAGMIVNRIPSYRISSKPTPPVVNAPSYRYALAISTVVGMFGCFSVIRRTISSYRVTIIPTYHESSFNKLILELHKEQGDIDYLSSLPRSSSEPTFFNSARADDCAMYFPRDVTNEQYLLNLCSEDRDVKRITLRAFTGKDNNLGGGVAGFTDKVTKVEWLEKLPLYGINVGDVPAFTANGMIVYNSQL
jgi:hypothetical protein